MISQCPGASASRPPAPLQSPPVQRLPQKARPTLAPQGTGTVSSEPAQKKPRTQQPPPKAPVIQESPEEHLEAPPEEATETHEEAPPAEAPQSHADETTADDDGGAGRGDHEAWGGDGHDADGNPHAGDWDDASWAGPGSGPGLEFRLVE